MKYQEDEMAGHHFCDGARSSNRFKRGDVVLPLNDRICDGVDITPTRLEWEGHFHADTVTLICDIINSPLLFS